MLYYHARYYDPLTGRFTSPDSIVPNGSDPQSFNRYSYVRNNPLSHIDPTGHRELECDGGSGKCSGSDSTPPTDPPPTPTPAAAFVPVVPVPVYVPPVQAPPPPPPPPILAGCEGPWLIACIIVIALPFILTSSGDQSGLAGTATPAPQTNSNGGMQCGKPPCPTPNNSEKYAPSPKHGPGG